VSLTVIHTREDLIWKDEALPVLDDEPGVGIEEQFALSTAEHCSRHDLAFHERYTSTRSSTRQELLVHGGTATAWASELSVESLLRLMSRSELVFVPLDGLQEELRVHLFEHRHK